MVYNPNNPVQTTTLPQDTTQPVQTTTLAQNTTEPLQPTNVNDMNVSDSAAGLYVDPSPIFQPSLDFIQQQRTQANERYGQNKADIANIFGNLTQVNKESQERVAQQYQASIADQQMKTAERLAQAQQNAMATQQSALRAIDERGGGPMGNIMASPAMEQAQRGMADTNRFAQIWQGQQGAIQEQTQQNLQSTLVGYGNQEVLANQQLQRSLEDTLNLLSGQETDVRTSFAEAVFGGKQQVAEANYNEVMQQKAADEAARLAAIQAASQGAQTPTFSEGTVGVLEQITYGADQNTATQFMDSINQVMAGLDVKPPMTSRPPTSLSDAYARWVKANPDQAAAYGPYAQSVFADLLSKSIPSATFNTDGGSASGNSSDPLGFGLG